MDYPHRDPSKCQDIVALYDDRDEIGSIFKAWASGYDVLALLGSRCG